MRMATKSTGGDIAPPTSAAESSADAAPEAGIERSLAAESMIKNYVIGAVSVSIVPVPIVDIAAVTALQLRMIQKLSELYGRPFSEELVRSMIASFGGSFLGYGAGMTAMSLLKIVPVFGWMLGMVSVPVVAGAATYAVGKVFVKHYEDGGSIFDLNPEKLKAFYRQQFERGKAMARAAAGKPASDPASANP
jgi:uncharacterized protein (DUF697 family)